MYITIIKDRNALTHSKDNQFEVDYLKKHSQPSLSEGTILNSSCDNNIAPVNDQVELIHNDVWYTI